MKASSFSVTVLGTDVPCRYITDSGDAERALSELPEGVLLGVDIETTPKKLFSDYPKAGLSPHLADIRLLQIFDGHTCYIFDLFQIPFEVFKPTLESRRFVAHNAVFELGFFLRNGVDYVDCTCSMLIAKLITHATYPTDSGLSASLESLVEMCFQVAVPKALQKSDFSGDLSFEQIEYAALDAIWCLRCAEKMASALQKFEMFRVYKATKEAQLPIVALQLQGVKLNVPYYRTLIEKWRNDLYADRKRVLQLTKLQKITGSTLGDWLEKNLPPDVLRIWPRTDTEKLSTSADTFADFSFLEIVEPFSRFQRTEKLTSTYGENLLSQISPATQRLHAQYKLLGARTGRLSSAYPNLQNLPRDEEVRAAFIPEAGFTFVRADYNQIELRVAAQLSGDKTMLDAYRKGIDLHALTASKVAGKKIEQVSRDERQKAKALNFGLLFGLGAKKFSHYAKKSYGVEVSNEEAHEAVDIFRETYAGYREWQMDQAERGADTMLSRTPLGKLRKLSTENCYGASMNTPVQGGAAEAMLRALTRIFATIDGKDMRLVNCVHDEILLEVKDEPDYVDAAKEIMKESMTAAFLDIFPDGVINNLVAPTSGDTWASAK